MWPNSTGKRSHSNGMTIRVMTPAAMPRRANVNVPLKMTLNDPWMVESRLFPAIFVWILRPKAIIAVIAASPVSQIGASGAPVSEGWRGTHQTILAALRKVNPFLMVEKKRKRRTRQGARELRGMKRNVASTLRRTQGFIGGQSERRCIASTQTAGR